MIYETIALLKVRENITELENNELKHNVNPLMPGGNRKVTHT